MPISEGYYRIAEILLMKYVDISSDEISDEISL